LGSSGFINGTQGEKYVKNRSAQWPFQVKLITNSNRKTALAYLQDSTAHRLPIIPSLADNAPYTVYECLYAGIPFIASDLSSISPLIAEPQDRASHLFQTKPHQLATFMMLAVRNGVAPVSATFTVAKTEAAWNSFYNNVKPKEPVVYTEDVPLVSVVITHYNRPVLVQQTIASIEAQDYSLIEIILVDDGSTDKDAIKFLVDSQANFESKGWRIIRGSNQYLGAARNTGARVARGKYLIFLDDDNTLNPTAISSYVLAAKLTGAKIVTAGHAVFSGTSAPTSDSVMRYWVPLGASLAAGLFKNTFGDANFFVERDSFLSVGGFTEEKGVGLEEHEFFANAVFAGQKLEIIPDILLNYRYHNEKHQMLYTTDIRLGEVRRLRPYLAAFTAPSSSEVTENVATEDNEVKKSLVHLVARNAVMPRSENCNGTVTAVSPSSGSVLGGTVITLTGTGFTCGTTSVTVDGNECTGVDIVSGTEITCTTPAGKSVYEAVDIVVVISGDSITLKSSYTYQPSPAPYLISAVLENSGELVLASFSSPTNRGGLSRSEVTCSALFDDLTLGRIGASATCTFPDDISISIALGPDAVIKVGDNVTVPAGVVRGKGPGGVANIRSSVVVTADKNETLIAPTVSIKTTAVVASCEGISLDASSSSGAGGRAFVSVAWQLTSSTNASQASIDAIHTILRNSSENRNMTVKFDASQVDASAVYVFTLELTNWLDISSSASVTVTKSTSDVPSISISGASLVKIFKTDAVTLTGVSGGLTCSSDESAVSYTWSVSPAVPALTDVSDAILTIPAGTLSAATTYVFTLTVSATGSDVANSANVTVVVAAKALVASITGGTGQYAVNATVILDASASYDPEDLAPLAFLWSCKTATNTPCDVSLSADSIQQFPASDLGTGTYTFTVTVSGAANRNASASTTITITAVPFLSISISMDSASSVAIDQIVYLYGAINQSNVAESDVEWQWSLVSGSIETSDAYRSTTTKTLAINSNVLAAGSSYTYKLVAIHAPSGTTGTATITFTTQKSSSDNSKTCAQSLTGGNTYTDVFLFDFGDSWALSSGVNKFQVFYQYSDSVVKLPSIPVNTSQSTVTSRLPVGTFTAFATASSSTGKSGSQNCSTTIAVADIATIDADIQAASNFYDLTREIYSVYKSKTDSSYLTTRINILVAISRNLNTKRVPSNLFNGDEFVLVPADLAVIANIQNGQLSLEETIGTGILLFQTLVLAISSRSNADNTDEYIQAIGNLAAVNTLLSTQIISIINGAQRSRSVTDDSLSTSLSQFTNPSDLSDPYSGVSTTDGALTAAQKNAKLMTSTLVAALPIGVLKTIITDTVTYSYEKNTPSTFDATGVAMGTNAKVIMPAGYVPTSSMKQDTITMKVTESTNSPYALPAGTTLSSKAVDVEGLDSSSSAIDFGAQPVTVVFNSAAASGVNDCVMYTDGNWTTEGVTTSNNNGATTCSYPKFATFAVINSPSGIQLGQNAVNTPTTPAEDKGSSKGWIGAIVGGVVGAAVVVVGGVFGVRKYRQGVADAAARQPTGGSISGVPAPAGSASGIAIPAPVEDMFIPGTEVPNAASPAALSRSMGVSPALFGFHPGNNNTENTLAAIHSPRSDHSSGSLDSTTSTGSSRSRYSGRSASSEESMEAEIRNIVGELNSNLPRNTRELEHLGEQLDTE